MVRFAAGSGDAYEVAEVGYNQLRQVLTESLGPGEVGYVVANVRSVKETRAGDTIFDPVKIPNFRLSDDERALKFIAGKRQFECVLASYSCTVTDTANPSLFGSETIVGTPADAGSFVVSGLTTAVSAGAGIEYSCALLADGTVWCWGTNFVGQLGDGTIGGGSAVPKAVQNLAGGSFPPPASHVAAARCQGGRVTRESDSLDWTLMPVHDTDFLSRGEIP